MAESSSARIAWRVWSKDAPPETATLFESELAVDAAYAWAGPPGRRFEARVLAERADVDPIGSRVQEFQIVSDVNGYRLVREIVEWWAITPG